VLRRPVDVVGPVVELGVITQGDRADTVAVVGRVVSEGGAPAASAAVAVHGLVGAGEFFARAVADVDGGFALALRPGHYTITAVGAVDGEDGLYSGDLVVDAAVDDLTLTLSPRLPVRLTVVDATGDPVAAASIELQRIGDVLGVGEPSLIGAQPAYVSATDDDGSSSLRVPGGRYRVSIQPPRDSGAPVFSALLAVDDIVERELVLPAAAILAGMVQDPSGGPTSGAVVRVFSPIADELGRAIYLGEALSTADGAFTLAVPDLLR
jgi:hypothetical protein